MVGNLAILVFICLGEEPALNVYINIEVEGTDIKIREEIIFQIQIVGSMSFQADHFPRNLKPNPVLDTVGKQQLVVFKQDQRIGNRVDILFLGI